MIAVLLAVAGVLSYIPGLDTGLSFEMFGTNMSVVFSLIGIGLWRCDHTSRRALLVMLHLPVLLCAAFSYELLSQFLSPHYDIAEKAIGSLWDGLYVFFLGALLFLAAYLPAFVLGDRKVKLLFAPSFAKKGFTKVDREKMKPSVSRKTIPALAVLSTVVGLLMAGFEDRGKIEFLDLTKFEAEHQAQVDYVVDHALLCSRIEAYFGDVEGAAVLKGSEWHVWIEPAFTASRGQGLSRFTIWPLGKTDASVLQSFRDLTPLPQGYDFSFPVLYKGSAFDEAAAAVRPVHIYRNWVQAPESEMLLQIVIVAPAG